ncbi:hypothetical protein LCGC14_0164950 [marine sediment metagenome]|uniref:Uncharacterized protein n=1 Tax=marine sediment metagenome TaxID=412755 RepID=A0A0F9XCZ1_9ZZZZ
MAKEKLTHWKSFRDRMMKHPLMRMLGVDWDEARSHVSSERTGFAYFVESEAVKTMIRGTAGHSPAVNEIYQTAVWDACGRHVIRPSADLFDLLVETEARLAISEIHPPFPAVYIALPPNRVRFPGVRGGYVEAEGCYVSWGPVGEPGPMAQVFTSSGGKTLADIDYQCRVLYVARGEQDKTHHDWTVRFQNIGWDEGETRSVDNLVMLGIEQQDKLDQAQVFDPIAHLLAGGQMRWQRTDVDSILVRVVANLFLYMSCPDADILENPHELYVRLQDFKKRKTSSKRRKSVRRQIEEGMIPQEVVVGSSVKIKPLIDQVEAEPTEGGEGSRKSPRPHWRKGHFRRVAIGEGRRERKLVWIWPILVRKTAAGHGAAESRGYDVT